MDVFHYMKIIIGYRLIAGFGMIFDSPYGHGSVGCGFRNRNMERWDESSEYRAWVIIDEYAKRI